MSLKLSEFREAFVVDNVVDVSSSMPTNELVQRHSHLQRLKFPELEEGRVDFLLGYDMHRAFLIKDALVGNPDSPCGLHTALGWTIFGTDKGDSEAVDSPQLVVNFMTTLGDEDRSCEQLIKLFSQDFDDIDENKDDTSLSQDNKRTFYILNDTVKKVDDHYSVDLLWRDDSKMSSDGRALAERRLKGLKRKFGKILIYSRGTLRRCRSIFQSMLSWSAKKVSKIVVAAIFLITVLHQRASSE